MSMHAAVVRSFGQPPRYETYDTPEPAEPGETVVDVLAVGLHPRVRSGASGTHYTSTGTLPMIPGIDGVGRLTGGQRIYFLTPDDTWGSMAERAVVDPRRTVPLPENADVAKIAAARDRAAFRDTPVGQPPDSGHRARRRIPQGIPCRTAIAHR